MTFVSIQNFAFANYFLTLILNKNGARARTHTHKHTNPKFIITHIPHISMRRKDLWRFADKLEKKHTHNKL